MPVHALPGPKGIKDENNWQSGVGRSLLDAYGEVFHRRNDPQVERYTDFQEENGSCRVVL